MFISDLPGSFDGAVRGRYAPSPTGPLHMGNVRTALLCWLHIRLQPGARLIMRIEDVDGLRSSADHTPGVLEDLAWLGLDWDEGPDVGGRFGPYTQSERFDLYDRVLEELEARGLAYPCYCSRKDVRAATTVSGADGGLVYPGTCRDRSAAELEEVARQKGYRPVWRFRAEGRVRFEDRVTGPLEQDLTREVGDFIIKRRDGFWAYQLAVVIDDIMMGVTDVLRGEDLLASTPRQIALYEALGATPPRFAHVPLMRGADGEKLSKRDGAESIAARRARGESAASIIARLAHGAGLIDVAEALSATELLQELSAEGVEGLMSRLSMGDFSGGRV